METLLHRYAFPADVMHPDFPQTDSDTISIDAVQWLETLRARRVTAER